MNARAICGVTSTARWYISIAALLFPAAASCLPRSLFAERELHRSCEYGTCFLTAGHCNMHLRRLRTFAFAPQ